MINIYIVDEHPLFIDGLKKILSTRTDCYSIAGYSKSPEKGLRKILKRDVDLVLMDLMPPQRRGLDFLKELKRSDPSIKVIVLCSSVDPKSLGHIWDLGVGSIQLKTINPDELFEVIRKVMEGETFVGNVVADILPS